MKCSLRAALLSLGCPDMVSGVGQIPSAAGHVQDGNYERVKESSVNVVSILVCLKKKINGDPSKSIHYSSIWVWGRLCTGVSSSVCLSVRFCGNCYTWTCVPWACRFCTLDKIFFWWPASVTPILDSSLDKRIKYASKIIVMLFKYSNKTKLWHAILVLSRGALLRFTFDVFIQAIFSNPNFTISNTFFKLISL